VLSLVADANILNYRHALPPTLTGSKALDEGVPATLVILAFLSPLAPDEAAKAALDNPRPAAAFLFFSRIILARLTVSVAIPPAVRSEEDLSAEDFTPEKGGEVLGAGGLGDRRLLLVCASFCEPEADAVAGDAAVLASLLYRRKTFSRYSSSAVRTSTSAAGLSSACSHEKRASTHVNAGELHAMSFACLFDHASLASYRETNVRYCCSLPRFATSQFKSRRIAKEREYELLCFPLREPAVTLCSEQASTRIVPRKVAVGLGSLHEGGPVSAVFLRRYSNIRNSIQATSRLVVSC